MASNALTARMALAKHGFEFTHSLGQNFLLDDGMIAHIVDLAEVREGDNVLEIGAGAGVLTAELSRRGAQVLALELDRSLEPVLGEVLAPYENVRVLFEDAMKADLAALTSEVFGEGKAFSVVANLPYYITADMILKLLSFGGTLKSITIMVQKEAAERILSSPGEKSWCALAATVQYFGKAEVLTEVPPEVFTPRPHVMSALLKIDLYGGEKPDTADEKTLLSLITAAFAMRRKTLANNLTMSFGMSRERALSLIESCNLDARVRGEVLSIKQLCELADKIHRC